TQTMTTRSLSFKDRVREERRRSVLDAARHLFVTQGYAGTTIEAIAETAGIGKGTIYLHFATKDELLIQLIPEASDAGLHELTKIADAGGPATEQLAASLRVCAASYRDNHDLITMNLPALRTVLAGQLGNEPPGTAVSRQLAVMVRRGQQEGSLRHDLDP